MEKFKIVYADCPWTYADKKSNDPSMGGITYDTMSLQELKDLNVGDICDKDSICLMWATMPLLQECLDVMKAWGFTYKTCAFNWVKTNPNSNITHIQKQGQKMSDILISGGLYSGMGHFVCGNAELVLLGKRGKGVPRVHKDVKQIQIHPRKKHSQKPIFHPLIERVFGKVPSVELFARDVLNKEDYQNWTFLGNEVTGLDIRESIEKLKLKMNE